MSRPPNASTWVTLLIRAIAVWLPIAAATTGLAAIIYGAMQQNLRLSADDPQAALAVRTAALLEAGAEPAAAVPREQVELATTLDPFVLVFDASGQLLASSATLHGRAVRFPTGVVKTVRARGEDRVTWQPEPGVREATVGVAWRGGVVVAGRSLLLTEQHIDKVGLLVAAGWIATLLLVGAAALLAVMLNPPPDVPGLRELLNRAATGATGSPLRSATLPADGPLMGCWLRTAARRRGGRPPPGRRIWPT